MDIFVKYNKDERMILQVTKLSNDLRIFETSGGKNIYLDSQTVGRTERNPYIFPSNIKTNAQIFDNVLNTPKLIG